MSIVFVHGLQGHPQKTWSCAAAAESQASQNRTIAEPQASTDKSWWHFWSHTQLEASKGVDNGSHGTEESANHSQTFWPKDLLAEDFPQARIFTFGYNTQVTRGYAAINQGSIFSHARNLLYDLEIERKDCRDRDLVFVAHSLGGIIVKEATWSFALTTGIYTNVL